MGTVIWIARRAAAVLPLSILAVAAAVLITLTAVLPTQARRDAADLILKHLATLAMAMLSVEGPAA
jgi:hypothetical protein